MLDEPPLLASRTLPASVTWMHGVEAPLSASIADVTPVDGRYASGIMYGQSFRDQEFALSGLML